MSKLRKSCVILLICLVFSGCQTALMGPPPAIRYDLSTHELIERFRQIVFFSEFSDRQGKLFKMSVPVRWHLSGRSAKRAEPYLPKIFSKLHFLTGLAFSRIDARELSNMEIIIAPRKDLLRVPVILKHSHQGFVYDSVCWATRRYHKARARTQNPLGRFNIVVGIPDKLRDGEIETCLWIEIVQSLGLPNDLETLHPSIFSDAPHLIQGDLPWYDALMVRVLYDDKLKFGMTEAQAMPIARRLIPKWQTSILKSK